MMPEWSFRSWLLRNAAPLVVMLLAAAALVGVVLGRPLAINAEYQAPPVEVAKGESYEAAGYTWTLVASGEFPHADNEDVPEGLALTAAIIEVRPAEKPETAGSCKADLVIGEGPEAQRWTALGNPSGFNYQIADDSTMTCLFQGEPFDLEVVYLTPEGTASDAVVEVAMGVLGAELVRFALTD